MEQREWRKLRIRFPVIMIWCCWIRQQIFVIIMIIIGGGCGMKKLNDEDIQAYFQAGNCGF